LKEKNPDTVGWIKVEGTNIDYPVVRGKNNDFYLNHSFDKSPNGVGWVFADYRDNFDGNDLNTIIYGHNRRDGTMFGTLKNILKKEWYDNNTTITYADPSGVYNYKIFSIYRIEKEDYYITTGFQNKTEYKQFLDTLKSRSIKNFGVELTENDQILTLSTCANDNRYRVVLHAKVEKVPVE
jgi:sortase B